MLGTRLFIFFGWLSDRIGRKKIMLAGCLLGALTYFPLYRAMTHYVNPALERSRPRRRSRWSASDCQVAPLPEPEDGVLSECDKVQDFLSKRSLSFETTDGAEGAKPITTINGSRSSAGTSPSYRDAQGAQLSGDGERRRTSTSRC